jgi:hypothetical protein
MVRAALAERLGRPRMHLLSRPSDRPQVAMLLDVDREYREQAARSALPLISPQRFNPEGRAWLPVLHTTRGPWELTALYSNTRRAHELGRIRDWVVIHYQREDRSEDQCTVVTERHGALAGRRVVRGREVECQFTLLGDAAGRGMLRAGEAGGVISA